MNWVRPYRFSWYSYNEIRGAFGQWACWHEVCGTHGGVLSYSRQAATISQVLMGDTHPLSHVSDR